MAKCDCLLSHTNGGVCNCQDNSDWDNYEEVDDNTQEEEEEEFDRTRITKPEDDWFVQ